MTFARENEEEIGKNCELFEKGLSDLKAKYPEKLVAVEGKGLLAARHFGTLKEAAEFTDALHEDCVDASAQLYKVNCVPAVLFKPPVDSTEETLMALLSILDRVLAK